MLMSTNDISNIEMLSMKDISDSFVHKYASCVRDTYIREKGVGCRDALGCYNHVIIKEKHLELFRPYYH